MENKKIKKILLVSVSGIVVVGSIILYIVLSHGHAVPHSNFSESAFKYADLIHDGNLYPVVHVVDGDTIIVRTPDPDSHDVTIRLIGMDTPETVDPRKPVQCFGPEASAEGKRLLASTSVYVEKDPLKGDYEKYGRVLAYVRMEDGTLYNEHMIQQGFAHEYTYFHEPYKYQAQFKADEKAAKKAHLGLWGKCSKSSAQ